MTKIKLLNIDGKTVKDITIDESLFVEQPHKQAMFDAVIAENAAERQGTHSTLTKGEVRGGGKKPWRQKHTGKARTGSTRNPHWKGGGVVFGPKPTRNYTKKLNAKVRRLAFKSALTAKLNDKMFYGLEDGAQLDIPSTKSMSEFVTNAKFVNKKVLFVLESLDNNIQKSTNNLPKVNTKMWNQVSVKDVMHANVIIVQETALKNYKEVMA